MLALLRNRSSSIAPIGAIAFAGLLGAAVLAINASDGYRVRADAQAAADAAALAAVKDLPNAAATAQAHGAAQGFPNTRATIGQFTPTQGFQPESPANAVRVVIASEKQVFGGGWMGKATVPIEVAAIARASNAAAFSIGTALLRLEGGVINGLLSAWLGVNVSLSVMDYNDLASARVDLGAFAKALAIRTGRTDLSFGRLMQEPFASRDVLAALAGLAPARQADMIRQLSMRVSPAASMSLARLVDFGAAASLPASGELGTRVSMSLLDMLRLFAQVGLTGKTVDVALDLNVPVLASASLRLHIGQPVQSSGFVAIGTRDATVYSAQLRAQLVLQTGTLAGLPVGLRIPIHIRAAEGMARLHAITCQPGGQNQVQLAVRPGLFSVYLGEVAPGELHLSTAKIQDAALLSTPLVNVTARSRVAMEATAETIQTFTEADIAQGRPKSTSVTTLAGSLVQSLTQNAALQVELAGGSLSLLNGLSSGTVKTALGTVAGTLDPILASVLSAVGLRLGVADTWVHGVQCGGAVLVR